MKVNWMNPLQEPSDININVNIIHWFISRSDKLETITIILSAPEVRESTKTIKQRCKVDNSCLIIHVYDFCCRWTHSTTSKLFICPGVLHSRRNWLTGSCHLVILWWGFIRTPRNHSLKSFQFHGKLVFI